MNNIIPILIFLLFIVFLAYYISQTYKTMTLQQLTRWSFNKDFNERNNYFRNLFIKRIPLYLLAIIFLAVKGIPITTSIIYFGFFFGLYELFSYWRMKEIEKKKRK